MPPPTPTTNHPTTHNPIAHTINPQTVVDEMPTRNAEEADLSNASQEQTNNRQKTAPVPNDIDMNSPNSDQGLTIEQTSMDKDQPGQDGNTTLPNLNAIHYLATPTPNPLEVQGWDDNTTLEGVNPIQQSKWKSDTGAKVLIYKAYGGRIDTKDKVTQLREILKNTLRMSSNPTIAVPIPENTNN